MRTRSGGSGESMRMDDLMDSFNKMKTSTILDEQKRMMASADTMGTIDHLPEGNLPDGSIADMSMGMGSSTFSFFRGGNESMLTLGNSQVFSNIDRPSPNNNHNSSSTEGHSQLTSESSISLSEIFPGSNRRKSNTGMTQSVSAEVSASVKNAMDEVRREEEAARNARLGILQHEPRQVSVEGNTEEDFNMSGMDSTLDILKSALASNNTLGYDFNDSNVQR
jgi:hypothetical protein